MRYDIEAKSSANPNRTRALRMLQTLLADRFELQLRRETREGAIYHLVVSSGGLKLERVTESTPASIRIGLYTGRRTTAQDAPSNVGLPRP